MGAEPYWYYIHYQPDINAALQTLRQREFQTGRYYPATMFLEFSVTQASVSEAQHSSIEAAIEDADATGTQSILDIFRVVDTPCPYSEFDVSEYIRTGQSNRLDDYYHTAFSVPSDELIDLFGTEQPSHEMIESIILGDEGSKIDVAVFWDSIGRGTARYIVVYDQGQPSEIFFIGYSFD